MILLHFFLIDTLYTHLRGCFSLKVIFTQDLLAWKEKQDVRYGRFRQDRRGML